MFNISSTLGWHSLGNDIFEDFDKFFSRGHKRIIELSFKKKKILVAEICQAHPSEKERNFSQILEATSKCLNTCKKMRLIGVRLTLTLFNKSLCIREP